MAAPAVAGVPGGPDRPAGRGRWRLTFALVLSVLVHAALAAGIRYAADSLPQEIPLSDAPFDFVEVALVPAEVDAGPAAAEPIAEPPVETTAVEATVEPEALIGPEAAAIDAAADEPSEPATDPAGPDPDTTTASLPPGTAAPAPGDPFPADVAAAATPPPDAAVAEIAAIPVEASEPAATVAIESPAGVEALQPPDPAMEIAAIPVEPPAPSPPSAKPAVPVASATPSREQTQTALTAPRPAPTRQQSAPAGATALADYRNAVLARIRRQAAALGAGAGGSGVSAVAFVVDASGRITSQRLANSSGSSRLDTLALRIVGQAAPFPPPPASAGRKLEFIVPIRFTTR